MDYQFKLKNVGINKDFYNEARAIIPAIIEDKPTFELLRTVKDFLKQKEFNL